MIKNTLLYCATDKEIFDVLMSAKQKINEKIILEFAKDRGIFYSAHDSRDDLISKVSLLPHDYHDLNSLLEQREHAGRSEKLTSVTLNAVLTADEIKEAIKEYTAESLPDEKITHHTKGNNQILVNVKYSDMDYGKTRLIQRTPKEAGIEFHVEAEKTIIRMPANERSNTIFGKLKDKLDTKKKSDIQSIRIEINEFTSPELRTEFFTSLLSGLNGFKPENVTSVKIERLKQESDADELDLDDDQTAEEAKQEALSLVKNVALRGETLLASEEYQSLIKKGFFITSIIWRSKLEKSPQPIIEFEAAFEEPALGKGFKYSVRGAYILRGHEYTKSIRAVTSEEKEKYLQLIEETAANTIETLRAKNKAISGDGAATGEQHGKD